jgi:hypothetical protein
MYDSGMSDGDVIANCIGHITVAVNDGTILHVDALAKRHGRNVAAHDGVEPEAGQFSDCDIADDRSIVRKKKIPAGFDEERRHYGILPDVEPR